MKKTFLVLITFFVMLGASFATQPKQITADSISAVGEFTEVVVITPDTAIVTNLDGEQFRVVGENVGLLVTKLAEGYSIVKNTESGKPLDYLINLLPWLLGGGITSVIAYATRAVNGIQSIFNGIEKDYKIVLGVAAALAFGWQFLQGESLTTMVFWGNFAVDWLKFGGAAFVLYLTILQKFMKSPENPVVEQRKVDKAVAMLSERGFVVTK